MPLHDPNFKVIIIGAGVSGLSLAQILRKAGVPFEVFERDDGTRNQGGCINLDKPLDRLKSLVPDDVPSIYNCSANHAIGKTDGFAISDSVTHDNLGVVGNVDKGQPGHLVTANRNKLRQMLMQSLDVKFEKRFFQFREDASGVTAFFTDGTLARGSVLVGADGASSPVRSQLLPGFKPDMSPYIALHGNVLLDQEMHTQFLKDGNSGIITGGKSVKAYFALMDYYDDRRVLFNWNCSWKSQNPVADYEWAENATQQELLNLALEMYREFPPYIVEAIRATGSSGMRQPPVKYIETVLPDIGLPKGHVTLAGDVAHSMVPFRGMGANTAIEDACDLGELIINVAESGKDVESMISEYQTIMVPRGRDRVLESRVVGESGNPLEIAGGRL